VPCAKGNNGTPPDLRLCRELWTGRRSATSRQWSGKQACHKHHGNQRDGSSGQNLGWKLCVKDKWFPEWRDLAGLAEKGNNGSQRPYIRPQTAGSWISRSRGVKPSRSVKILSEQSVNRVNYKGATRRIVGSSAVESLQGARSWRDVRDMDIRNLRIGTQVAEVRKASHS